MAQLGLETEIVDRTAYASSVRRFREQRILLPTFAQLAAPGDIPADVLRALDAVDPDAPHPLNLFRVHWRNGGDRPRPTPIPEHCILPPELTGVPARIIVLFGDRFPMIGAHKVLAAYGCLAPRIITGQFDPAKHKAIWPSTGNYCRGGVAISRIMGCRGVAVLPEGMSAERFAWLDEWVADAADIIRTPGSESNVKEIYDACNELDRQPGNIIFNQFSEFGNHLIHYLCTGKALADVFEEAQTTARAAGGDLTLRAFVSATGSAGTLGAGDYLQERYGSQTVALEALECPTMLWNGFGVHNIQGIGDKHIPLIHNVMATDLAMAVSSASTDRLNMLFNTEVGRAYLAQSKSVAAAIIEQLPALGLSSICNVLGAIKTARYLDLSEGDAVITVATDGAAMYASELEKAAEQYFPAGFDTSAAAETFGRDLLGVTTDSLLDLTHADRQRIFNLGYFTWVEQQGVSLEAFEARRQPGFWTGLRDLIPAWDRLIEAFNDETGVLSTL